MFAGTQVIHHSFPKIQTKKHFIDHEPVEKSVPAPKFANGRENTQRSGLTSPMLDMCEPSLQEKQVDVPTFHKFYRF